MPNAPRLALVMAVLVCAVARGESPPPELRVIGYYAEWKKQFPVEKIPADKLTHVNYAFAIVKDGKIALRDAEQARANFPKLVELKKKHPRMRTLISVGGWADSEGFSDAALTHSTRAEFAHSCASFMRAHGFDGVDIDWEFPVSGGEKGNVERPEDKRNFTALVKDLRTTMGDRYEISFAAGGFQEFLEEAIEWKEVMDLVDRVNLMTYDLVNGNSTVTGHHTPLYSTKQQRESTDNAVQYLVKLGIPANKLVIGSAFYGRMWENVAATNNGLYQSGKFKKGVNFRNFGKEVSPSTGFKLYWDDVAKAPYAYNASQKLFVTYDDKRSMDLKTTYALEQGLNGIMFWEITNDTNRNGLLHAIDAARKGYKGKGKKG